MGTFPEVLFRLMVGIKKLDNSRQGGGMAQSIMERYGGFASVRRIVSDFYDRVLDSAQLAPYFATTDMRTQIDHQTKFIAQLMGGPVSYSDEVLRKVHAPLHVTRSAFEEITDMLRDTLQDNDLAASDVEHVIGEMRRREPHIVTRWD